ncbi:MAG: MFS transporter [Actinobacteria bacterium]|nr:MFS transporter [Actinomycetota bacterium]
MTGNRAATFQSLRVRNFRLFVAGQLLSGIGTWMQSVAAPWLVLQLTGSGVALGIDVGLTFLPILLFGAWGGVLADRFDNRRLQLLTQVAYAVLSMALWLLVITRVVEVWMVFVISFLMGVVTAVDMPTRQSFYLEMVGRNQLTNAMSLSTATFMGARMVGPALAGVLIGTVGVAPVFLINGISYLAVIVALLLMRSDELQRREPVPARRGQIREGVAYVWRTPALRLPMLLMAGVFMFAFNFAVLLPLLAVRSFGGDAGTYGNLLALFGGGSLAGALIMAARSSTPNVPRLALFAVLLGAVSLAVAAAPQLLVAGLLMPALGAIGIAFAITGNSTLQLTAADDMRGRVMALYGVIFLGSTPLGGPIAGWVGEHLGPRIGLAGGGIIAIAAGVLAVAGLRASRNEVPPVAAMAADVGE